MKIVFKRLLYSIFYRIRPIEASRYIGVNIGSNCRLCGKINWGSEPYLVSLGSHVSITNSSFVTHDGAVWVFRDKEPDIDVVSPISIGSNVFIGANSIILPGSVIEDNVIVGAGSIVRGNLKSGCVYAGVPVKFVKTIEEYYSNLGAAIVRTKLLSPEEKKQQLLKKFRDFQ